MKANVGGTTASVIRGWQRRSVKETPRRERLKEVRVDIGVVPTGPFVVHHAVHLLTRNLI